MSFTQLVPPRETVSVTKSDSTEYNPPLRFLWVGVGGDVAIRLSGDSSATVRKNVPSGSYLFGQITHVYSTDTNASSFVGER